MSLRSAGTISRTGLWWFRGLAQGSASLFQSSAVVLVSVVSGLRGVPLLLNPPGLPVQEEARCTPGPTGGDPEAFPGQMRYIIPPVSSGSVPGFSPGWILIRRLVQLWSPDTITCSGSVSRPYETLIRMISKTWMCFHVHTPQF